MGRGYSGNHPRFSHRQDERYLRMSQGKGTKKDERKSKRETKKTMRHVKKHGSGLKMD